METIFKIISLTLFLGLFLSPVLILWRLNRTNIRNKFIIYLTIGILTTSTISLTFGWWTDTSDQILLEHYGFNIVAMNDTERFGKVSPENLERVKSLETSMMGIGWPLKVITTYVLYTPYLFIVYFVSHLFTKNNTTDINTYRK